MNNINGKIALITGGSKGIGKGVAIELLENGLHVAVTGRSEKSLSQLVDDLKGKYGEKIMGIVADVRSLKEQERAIHKIHEKWGSVDIVIANAGIGHFASIEDLTSEQWKDVIDINLTGVFNTVKSSLEDLIKNQGYLITIASLAGTNFFETGSAYNASKFGLVGFTQAVMLDLRKHGVKVTTIMPGSVATYFNDRIPGEKDNWKIQPEDIGKIVVDLLTMHPRTLPSKVEVRPSIPPSARK
jgi:NADP-dependent 3-hydroxy acid dehydrogenase YdfG